MYFEFHYKDCVGKVKWELVKACSEPFAHYKFSQAHKNEVITVLEVFQSCEELDFSQL